MKKQLLLSEGDTKIYATGIFRDIKDKELFVKEFFEHIQLTIYIISHEEEAQYLEKAWTNKWASDDLLLVINIGGKTTELIIYDQQKIIKRSMLNVGVGTILKRYPVINDEYSKILLTDIVEEIKKELPQLSMSIETAIYTGGELTYMQVAGYPLDKNYIFSDETHPFSIKIEDFSVRNDELFYSVSIDTLRSMMPDNPDWMNGARACSALAQAICEHFDISVIIPSDSNLIDGINISLEEGV